MRAKTKSMPSITNNRFASDAPARNNAL